MSWQSFSRLRLKVSLEVETKRTRGIKTGEVSDVASNAVSDPLADVLEASAANLQFPPTEEELNRSIFQDGKAHVSEIKTLTPEESIEIDRVAEKMLPELAEGLEVDGFQVFTKNGTPLTGIISQEELKRFIQPPMLVVDRIDLSEFAKLDDIRPGTVISYEPQQPDAYGPGKRYFIVTDFGSGPDKTVVAVIEQGTLEAPDKLVGIFDIKLGELDSGEYRHTVRIAEAYVEGAEAARQSRQYGSFEDWLSLQLNTYLERWWFAAGPKS